MKEIMKSNEDVQNKANNGNNRKVMTKNKGNKGKVIKTSKNKGNK